MLERPAQAPVHASAQLLGQVVLAGVVARVLLREPWVVEAAVPGTPSRQAWRMMGWRRSSRVVTQVAQARELGHGRPHVEEATPVEP